MLDRQRTMTLMAEPLPAPLITTVNGVPVIGVPVQDLIETDLEQALPLELWDLFPEESDRTWRP